MVKGMYGYIRDAWKKPVAEDLRQRLIQWRKEDVVVRLEKPTRLDRARALGYKAKPGIVVVRVRVLRGGRQRHKRKKARRSKRQTSRKTVHMNYQHVAEQRAAKKYINLEVLNSYWVGKDGMHYFFEVVMVDPSRPEIQSDEHLKWLCDSKNRGRVFRGLTSAAKKSREITTKR